MNMTVSEQQDLQQDNHLMGLAALMRMTLSGADMGSLGLHLIQRAGADPYTQDGNALMDLSTILQLRGDRELGLSIQRQALAIQQIYTPPMGRGQFDRSTASLRLLAIMGEGDLMANSPLEFLLEDQDVALDLVYVADKLPENLPAHDVLFVAIAESKRNIPLLAKVEQEIAGWPHSVLNRPELIARLSRDSNGERLRSATGIDMPATEKIAKADLARIACGELLMNQVLDDGDFPVIVRPVDSHAGQGLEKLAVPEEVADYLSRMSCSEFYVSRFVDYRNADGQFRKYRIVLIEGRPFVAHMAISQNWMIHYLNAGMADSVEKRAEEAQFMADFDSDFALRHAAAFAQINARMGLDYVGIDCAESADGRLLIFEVDSCMIVHAVDSIELYPYKQPQMQKIFSAFRQMLLHATHQD